MNLRQIASVVIPCLILAAPAVGQQVLVPAAQPDAVQPSSLAVPNPEPAGINGTVSDTNGGIIPGADVVISGPAATDRQTTVANDNGGFQFSNLKPGVAYHVTISATGFVTWTSPAIVLNSGQYMILTGSNLEIAGGSTSITVSAASSDVQLATQQVQMEEQQRVLGVIPNFYVVYDHNAAPLTPKLKFKLAWKAETDPVTALGVGFVAGLDQTGATPDYGEGAKGYFERVGAVYGDGFTDILFGGAVLPVLLHQDPRYFYKGEGSTRSRILYAMAGPFICKGDNGRWQPNYSSVGGDLISGAISNAYYPRSNRGASLVFVNAGITTGGRMVNDVVQEFLLKRFTPAARNRAE
ncbi:MAG TPA: carboxypeptidase-like regulatory domain-containing protein [Terracidiphilus sp.]